MRGPGLGLGLRHRRSRFAYTSPAALSGLAFWLFPNDLAPGAVGSWADKNGSGTTFTQITGANKPNAVANANFLGNRQAITLSGTQWMTDAAAVLGNNGFSLYFAAKGTAAGVLASLGVNTGHTTGWAYLRNANGGFREALAVGVADVQDGIVSSAWEVIGLRRASGTGTTWRMSVNGVDQGALTHNTSDPTAQSAISTLFALDSNGSTGWVGSCDEIVGYSRALTDAEDAGILGYFANGTGIMS